MLKSNRFFFLFVVFGVGITSPGADQVPVDSLFVKIVAQTDSTASIKARLKVLKNLLKKYPDYAPAYHEMAKLYMAQRTLNGRINAGRALQKAIGLDKTNVAYQLTLGDLFWAQGFKFKAEEQFQKIYDSYPDNAKAAYMIGQQRVKQFYHYQNMGRAFRYLAQEDLEKAILHLKRSIELNPKSRDPYYALGGLYAEQNRPGELVQLADQMLQQYPGDKDALLFKGLGLQQQKRFEEAYGIYETALAQMDADERAIMESVDWIVNEDERSALKETKGDSTDTVWKDRSKRETFWRRQDPLFLTSFNERRLAHYGRIAYANLLFSRPSKGIKGWQTDMGKTYIRFGPPLRKRTIRPEIVPPASWGEFMTFYTHREDWFYEGFKLTFQNRDGIDDWHFATIDVSRINILSAEDLAAGKFSFSPQALPTTDRLASDVFKKVPARYIDPYRSLKYSVPYQLVRFKEADSIRVELSYVLPRGKLLATEKAGTVDLENGIFLFDNQWQQVYRNVDKVRLNLGQNQTRANRDSLYRNNLLSIQDFKVKPGDYHMVIEARSLTTGTIGTVRQPYEFTFSDQGLSASDLLLARNIEPLIPFPEKRKDLRIVPNPIRTFYSSDPVYIYLEVYNLKRDDFGQTRYEITYRLAPPDQKAVDPALFLAMDFSKKQGVVEIDARQKRDAMARDGQTDANPFAEGTSEDGEESGNDQQDNRQTDRNQRADTFLKGETEQSPDVHYQVKYVLPQSRLKKEFAELAKNGIDMSRAITAEYEGRNKDDFTFLQIDVAQVPAGIYQLIVTIKDSQTQQSVVRKTLFRLLK